MSNDARPLRPWQEIAAEVAKETDAEKVAELVKELDRAFDEAFRANRVQSDKPPAKTKSA